VVAAIHDFVIEQGSTVAKVFTWKDSSGTAISLVGYTARCKIKKRISDSEELFDLTTENGGITLGGIAGTIQLNISAANTSAVSGYGVYDVEVISSGGLVTRIAEGNILFKRNVSV
jgi:hypothetical protein